MADSDECGDEFDTDEAGETEHTEISADDSDPGVDDAARSKAPSTSSSVVPKPASSKTRGSTRSGPRGRSRTRALAVAAKVPPKQLTPH